MLFGVNIMPLSKSKGSSASKEKASISDLKTETELQGEDFYQMVSEAAYYRAEKRNFASGHEMEDWIEAEAEILDLQKENLAA